MKALTLLQPWASLIAWGEKTVETRSWTTDYRGPLWIHAAQRLTLDQKLTCWQAPFANVLPHHGVNETSDLRLGAVLCLVDLVDVGPVQRYRRVLSKKELAFGNYAPGRFAWKLENLRLLEQPIFARGHQGLWNWTFAPADVRFVA